MASQKVHKRRSILESVKSALPHACIIVSLMMLVFFVIDRMNKHQEFMTNEFHKWLTLVLCITGIGTSIIASGYNRRVQRARQKKAQAAKRKQ